MLQSICIGKSVHSRSPTNDFTSFLSGRLIMYLDALLIFTEHDWSPLIEGEKSPVSRKHCGSLWGWVRRSYILRGGLQAKENLTGKQHMTPGPTEVKSDDIHFLSPYTTMLQSSCTGKTRFLLDPVKEDAKSRSYVIYLTMHSNLEGVPVTYQLHDMLLGWLETCNSLEEISTVIHTEKSIFINILIQFIFHFAFHFVPKLNFSYSLHFDPGDW